MLAARPTRQHVRDAFERIDWACARLDTAASLPDAQARLKLGL